MATSSQLLGHRIQYRTILRGGAPAKQWLNAYDQWIDGSDIPAHLDAYMRPMVDDVVSARERSLNASGYKSLCDPAPGSPKAVPLDY